MLRPIVKFCLNRSVKVNDFIESVKVVFIELAREQIEASGAQSSVSKLSVMTGIHRRDVTRISQTDPIAEPQANLAGRVLAQWQTAKPFVDSEGAPRVLSVEGKRSEFWNLVQSVSVHLNPYTVLFELERVNAVRRTKQGLEIVAGSFTTGGDLLEGAKVMAIDVEDFMMAIEENLSNPDSPPNYHTMTEYDRVDESAVPQIRRWIIEQGSIFHKKAREFLSKFDADINPKLDPDVSRVRVSVGGFSRITGPPKMKG